MTQSLCFSGNVRRTLPVLLLSVFVACQATSEQRGAAAVEGTRTDSAGVAIVEHTLPHTLPAADESGAVIWRLRNTPTLRLDSIPRAERAEFFKIGGAAFLDSGRLVIGHQSAMELLLFEKDGRFVQTIGRSGSGPGEFRALEGPWSLRDNRFAVSDAAIRRVTVFADPDTIVGVTMFTSLTLSDSSYFVWKALGVTRGGVAILWVIGPPVMTVGASRPNMSIVAVDSAGKAWRVGSDRPGIEQYAIPTSTGRSFALGISPFAASPLITACGDHIAVADNQSYAVTMLGLDARVSLIVRAPVAQRPATDDDYRAVARGHVDSESEITEEAIASMRTMTPRGLLPVLHAIHCDAAGNFWVEEYPDHLRQERRVVVYTPTGARRFVLMLPRALRILGVHDMTVALAVTDDDGVEHVELREVESSIRSPGT